MADELLIDILEEAEVILTGMYKYARYPSLNSVIDKIHYYNLLTNEWFD